MKAHGFLSCGDILKHLVFSSGSRTSEGGQGKHAIYERPSFNGLSYIFIGEVPSFPQCTAKMESMGTSPVKKVN